MKKRSRRQRVPEAICTAGEGETGLGAALEHKTQLASKPIQPQLERRSRSQEIGPKPVIFMPKKEDASKTQKKQKQMVRFRG